MTDNKPHIIRLTEITKKSNEEIKESPLLVSASFLTYVQESELELDRIPIIGPEGAPKPRNVTGIALHSGRVLHVKETVDQVEALLRG